MMIKENGELHYILAIKNGYKEIAKFLNCKIAAKNARDSLGKTPFDYDASDTYKSMICG